MHLKPHDSHCRPDHPLNCVTKMIKNGKHQPFKLLHYSKYNVFSVSWAYREGQTKASSFQTSARLLSMHSTVAPSSVSTFKLHQFKVQT